MLLFLLLTAVTLSVAVRSGRSATIAVTCLLAFSLTLLGAGALEIASGNVDMFKSDELFYMETATTVPLSDILVLERSLWHLLNYWVLNVDLSLNGVALKLVNVALLGLLVVVLHQLFDREDSVLLLPFCLPYLVWVATFNLRDIPILLATALCALCYRQTGSKRLLLLVPLLVLFFLRPFAAFFVAGCVALFEGVRFLSNVPRQSILKTAAGLSVFAFAAVFSVAVFWENISRVAMSYYQWFLYTTGDGRAEHLARVADAYKSDSLLKDIPVSMLRYAATPIPTSLLERLMEGGDQLWGFVDDSVRFVHQTAFYSLVVYLGLRFNTTIAVIRKLTAAQLLFVAAMLSYWPIYSIHLYGATHQRSKLPIQIVVFLLFVLVWRLKTRRQAQAQAHEHVASPA